LKIRLAAPPVDGEANLELLRFLKKKFKPGNFEIIRGEKSKVKDLTCENLNASEVEKLFNLSGF